MGFSDSYVHSVSTPTPKAKQASVEASAAPAATTVSRAYSLDDETDSNLIPDQEILDATEEIYFRDNVDTGVYELQVRVYWIEIQLRCVHINKQSVIRHHRSPL